LGAEDPDAAEDDGVAEDPDEAEEPDDDGVAEDHGEPVDDVEPVPDSLVADVLDVVARCFAVGDVVRCFAVAVACAIVGLARSWRAPSTICSYLPRPARVPST
jgi:hypothetical protein